MSIDWSMLNLQLIDGDLRMLNPWSALETEWARREANLQKIQAEIDGPEETSQAEFNIECDTSEEPLSPDTLPLFLVLYTELAS